MTSTSDQVSVVDADTHPAPLTTANDNMRELSSETRNKILGGNAVARSRR